MTLIEESSQIKSIKNVLIVDDAFDEIPLATEITTAHKSAWSIFVDDMRDEDYEAVQAFFSVSSDESLDDYRESDLLIQGLWQHRSAFRAEHIDPLFQEYEQQKAGERETLDRLIIDLESAGLTCQRAGRDFLNLAEEVDLIFVDLFLGITQSDDDMKTCISTLRKLMKIRKSKPPLIILMSRNSLLNDKRLEFRDSSGLLESTFRTIRKADFAEDGKVRRIVFRLAEHYEASLKLAGFLQAWREGINQAGENSIKLMRKLDLADYAHIHRLVLNGEEVPTGSYLVDVFDRALQHEIEGIESIMEAAAKLNTLDNMQYPPPYISGSHDLQELMYRTLFQNPKRLALAGSMQSPVSFGDLLHRVELSEGDLVPSPFHEVGKDNVLVVMTPACDLQRKKAKKVLLLTGTKKRLNSAGWFAKTHKTIAMKIDGKTDQFIEWDFDHIETISFPELDNLLSDAHGYRVFARLRESHALELQQKLLSNLGRVGQMAPMPATFPVQVKVYYLNKEGELEQMNLINTEAAGGVAYVTSEKNTVLMLNEDSCEEIISSLPLLDSKISTKSSDVLNILKDGLKFTKKLEEGLKIPEVNGISFVNLPQTTKDPNGCDKVTERSVVAVTRNIQEDQLLRSAGQPKRFALIVAIYDHDFRPAPATEEGS